jgi:tetratricopeptide (TPR) repeat protein
MQRASAVTDAIRHHLRLGQRDRARELLDAALAAPHQHPEHLYLRGMLNAEAGAHQSALADFDATLRLMPGLPPALFNRALVLFRLERSREALEDFVALCRVQPDNADVWTNIGIIHLREARSAQAIDSLRVADRLAPGSPLVMRTLANALRDAGRFDESLRLHRSVLQLAPGDPAAQTDCALCLLSQGDAAAARDHYRQALALDASDQTALAGLYMASNELGEEATVETLMDYGNLLACGAVPATGEIDLSALRTAIVEREQLVWEPAGRSTLAGQQSPLLDLSPGSYLQRYERLIVRHVEQRMQQLAGQPRLHGHPWMAGMPRRWRVQSWITILEQGGRQTPHIHPAGWLSGVVYVDAGHPATEGAGDLVFGRAQADVALQRAAREHAHRPVNGQIVTFPSYFFHHTVPYLGNGTRVSLAFDVVPVS